MFRFIMTAVFFTGFSLGIWAATTQIDTDGMLIINGQRQFIIGLYEEAKDDASAEEISQAGFNLIRVTADQAALDRAQKKGLLAWIPVGMAVLGEQQESALSAIVNSWKDHPALAVWEAPDEALWNVWWNRVNRAEDKWKSVEQAIRNFQGNEDQKQQIQEYRTLRNRYHRSGRYRQSDEAEAKIREMVGLPPDQDRLGDWDLHLDEVHSQLQRGCEIVRKQDSNHVLWFNHAPRNSMEDLKNFSNMADIIGCDIYPVPFGPTVGHSDLAERNLSSVGRFTERMAAAHDPKKAVWMVLQGFGWDDLSEDSPREPRPRPTLEQSRFMAYDTIVNGAKGILYWGTFSVPRDTPFWTDLKKVTSELHGLEPFLSAPEKPVPFHFIQQHSAMSDEKGIRWMVREVDGKWMFLFVNESDAPRAFDLTEMKSLENRCLKELGGDEELIVKEGRITYGLPALTAAILLSN